jgi:hypothetical protein
MRFLQSLASAAVLLNLQDRLCQTAQSGRFRAMQIQS